MSDRRYTAIFGAAVLTAGVATFSVYHMLRTAAEPRREPTRAVVLVARDVPAGVPVPREALTQVLWPERVAPAEAFVSVDSVAGRVTRTALTRGEPVRADALAPRGAAPGLEGAIGPDHRAIAVRVNEAAGVSGLVRPNSRVDVLVTSRGDATGTTARLVMSDVRVLGVGPARPDNAKDGDAKDQQPLPANVASIVTLEVTPAQAALAAAAEQTGTIQVVLRGFGSRTVAGATSDAVIADAPVAVGPGGLGTPGGIPAFQMGAAPAPSAPAPVPASTPGVFKRLSSHPAPARPAEPAAAVAAAVPARPQAPDSVSIRVYRGGQMTVVRVEATPAAGAPPSGALRTAALGQP